MLRASEEKSDGKNGAFAGRIAGRETKDSRTMQAEHLQDSKAEVKGRYETAALKNIRKTITQTIIMGVLAILFCIGLLIASSLTPQPDIQEHAEESAGYFKTRELFERLINKQDAVKRDNYADCISFGIAYQLGNKQPVEGADRNNAFIRSLEARYTAETLENVDAGFYRAVYQQGEANQPYSRYWHGGAAVIRLLLPLFNVVQMRNVMFILGIIINLAWVIFLVMKKEYALAISYIFGIIAGKILFAYTCFEYAFVCFMVPLFSIAVYAAMEYNAKNEGRRYTRPGSDKEKDREKMISVEGIFLVAGICACFFDFLTAETATFTVPAFVAICFLGKKKKKTFRITGAKEEKKALIEPWFFLLRIVVCWFAGYALMFGLKWGLNAVFLGREEAMLAINVAAERAVGDVHVTLDNASPVAGFGQRMGGIFVRNFACLYGIPAGTRESVIILILLGVPAVVYTLWFFLRRREADHSPVKTKEKKDYSFFLLFLVPALIPILRLAVLSNHSYTHYFFTYRALMADVMIVTYIFLKTTVLDELLDN